MCLRSLQFSGNKQLYSGIDFVLQSDICFELARTFAPAEQVNHAFQMNGKTMS